MNILVVAAHPDDEALGCGGTIARLAREGHEIFIVILGEGVTSRYDTPDQAHPQELIDIKNAARKVAEILGAADLYTCGFPDNRLDQLPLIELVKRIESIERRINPRVVFTHHPGDLNIDHQCAFRATLTATRALPGSSVREVYSFEIPSSTEWAFGQISPPFEPDTFYDISETLEAKIAALGIYDTEMRPFPHPRSPEALRATAHRWGSAVGVRAAEAFKLVRRIV